MKCLELRTGSRISCCASRTFACRVALNDRTHRPVFFVCDEFQEIVSANRDGLSDLNFWDKARSTKTIGIIAAQAVSSFYAALGERDVADALLQNFRHTLCFRTEDAHTIDRLHRLIGQVDVAQASYGDSTSTGTTWTMQGVGSSTTETTSTHLSLRQQAVLDAQRLRTLGPDQAVAVLSLGGRSADDVLDVLPVYA